MTHKRTEHARAFRVLRLFLAIVTVLLAPATPTASASTSPLFLPVASYSSGGAGTNSVAAADLNGDGKVDLVVVNQCGNGAPNDCPSGTVGVLLGIGNGTFQSTSYGSGGFAARSVAVGDMDGDGKPDLIVANQCGSDNTCQTHSASVGVLLGNGNGTFQPAATYDSGGFAGAPLAVADLDGDGKLDVVVAHCDVSRKCSTGTGNVAVLLGKGDGSLQPAVLYDSGGQDAISVALADVNRDGRLDILASNCAVAKADEPFTVGVVGVLLGWGDGTFEWVLTYDSGVHNTRSSAVADINGDGNPDLLVSAAGCCGEGEISVLVGDGDGTFQPPLIYGSGACDAVSVAVSDLNGDGKPDLLVANGAFVCGGQRGAVSVLPGNGDGTFQSATTYDSGGFAPNSAVAAADVNGDGKPDAIVITCADAYCASGFIGVLLNNTPFCRTPPVITVSTTPTLLWPPNGNMVPVTASGTITDPGCTITAATYTVIDEYGKVQPSGLVKLRPGGAYSFTILLQASRLGTDIDGRVYTITVSASNNTSMTGSEAIAVIVPHDQRR